MLQHLRYGGYASCDRLNYTDGGGPSLLFAASGDFEGAGKYNRRVGWPPVAKAALTIDAPDHRGIKGGCRGTIL